MNALWRLVALLPLALLWAGVGALVALAASSSLSTWPWPFMVAGALLALGAGHLPRTPEQLVRFYRWAVLTALLTLFVLTQR